MQPLDVFKSPFDAREIEDDRQTVARFLEEYLRTGVVPEVPRTHNGNRMRLDGNREPMEQCSWRWSEARGKYVGVPFWSVSAVGALGQAAAELTGRSLSAVAAIAARKDRGALRLQHEHVFPRKAWRQMLRPRVGNPGELGIDDLVALMDRYCVGCIVTWEEHRELPGTAGNEDNPWLRYRDTSIRLAFNPAWSEPHHTWIAEAGLVDESESRLSA